MRTQNAETIANMTPQDAYKILVDGNERFAQNVKAQRNYMSQVTETSQGQFPFAAILSCIDSRVPAELVFDQGIGDIFSIRVAGNISNDDVIGSMEFACKVAGSKLIMVLGHTRCGAVLGACDNVEMGKLTGLVNKIKPAVEEVRASGEFKGKENTPEFRDAVAKVNVDHVIEIIKNESEILSEMIENEEIAIVGAMYDVVSGTVEFEPFPVGAKVG